jgi:hypothetical protein
VSIETEFAAMMGLPIEFVFGGSSHLDPTFRDAIGRMQIRFACHGAALSMAGARIARDVFHDANREAFCRDVAVRYRVIARQLCRP